MKPTRARLDVWDFAAFVGLGLMGYGLSLWSQPVGVVFLGLVVFGLGVWGSFRWAS